VLSAVDIEYEPWSVSWFAYIVEHIFTYVVEALKNKVNTLHAMLKNMEAVAETYDNVLNSDNVSDDIALGCMA
jgi:hypothetical protein